MGYIIQEEEEEEKCNGFMCISWHSLGIQEFERFPYSFLDSERLSHFLGS